MASVLQFVIFILILNTTLVFSEDTCVEIPPNNKPAPTKESEIKEHILCDYDKTVRPVVNNNATKLVFILVAEKMDFMSYSGYVSLETTIILKWTDEHLFWDPNDYDGTKKIYLNTDEIWTPDLSVYNRASYGEKEIIDSGTKCTVYYDKKVVCIFESTLKGACTPNLRHWPYDVQNCTIVIGSWLHTGNEIDYSFTSIKKDMSLYHENQDFALEDLKMTTFRGIYMEYPNNSFPSLKVNIVMSRRIGNKFVCVMMPFIVLVSMTLITLLLDPRSSDRIFYTVLNIPCHIMFLFNVEYEMPETGSTVPYFILYLKDSNVLASVILIETMVVRYLLSNENTSPAWLITATTRITDNRAGKLLLYRELNVQDGEEETVPSEESGTLVEIKGKPSEWYLLGRLIDTLLLIITIIIYLVYFLICMT